MDSAAACPPCPRKALFQKQRGVTSKHSQTLRKSGYEKNDIMSSKAKIQFEHELSMNLKALDKELHLQRLEQLRHLAEKLKEDAWLYPDFEATLGI
ncbi:hypothetical protein AVEN_118419-1 [Araneus ventricosus]|uniref:Uncharacterized protein n=1 Tax=Araneus ventricosus TaxID=182803 RepID=A0A4Y2QY33_ARAVE|nr:hypothetical protein AVEN_46656-1 [Araneus ventricosus]GBN72041.1 hypothetical protein AVEN_118419-1 [Araneus ventricosus]